MNIYGSSVFGQVRETLPLEAFKDPKGHAKAIREFAEGCRYAQEKAGLPGRVRSGRRVLRLNKEGTQLNIVKLNALGRVAQWFLGNKNKEAARVQAFFKESLSQAGLGRPDTKLFKTGKRGEKALFEGAIQVTKLLSRKVATRSLSSGGVSRAADTGAGAPKINVKGEKVAALVEKYEAFSAMAKPELSKAARTSVEPAAVQQAALVQYINKKGLDAQEVQKMIKDFAPLVYLKSTDDCRPSSVEYFMERAALYSKEGQLISENPDAALLAQHEGDGAYLQKTSRLKQGAPIENNQAHAPVYVNFVPEAKDGKVDKAVIQYYFFYPYNGHTSAVAHGLRKAGLPIPDGAHQGDWEHVNIHVCRGSDGAFEVDEAFYSAHRPKRHGEYAQADQMRFEEGHPVVFAAQHGHASYPKEFKGPNRLLDSVDSKGPVWKTWEQPCLMAMGDPKDPAPGAEWLNFNGHWGKGGPRTPAFQGQWRKEFEEEREVQTLEVDLKALQGGAFSLVDAIPTRVRQLRWEAEGLPEGTQLTLSLKQKTALGQTKTVVENIILDNKGAAPFEGAMTKVPGNKNRLFISDIDVIGPLPPSDKKIKIKIYAVEPKPKT